MKRELATINKIANTFLTVPDDEVYGKVLQVVLEALRSEHGFFGFIGEEGSLVCPSLTRDIWDQCQVPDKSVVFPREAWGGLWGQSLKEKVIVCSNGPLKVPAGHVPVRRSIAVPIVHRRQLIGQIAVANKGTDYDERDQALLETIAGAIAPILAARLQRDRLEAERERAEKALRESEEKYHSLFEHANDSIFIIDPTTRRFLDVNENAARRLGYSREELLQLTINEIDAPQDAVRNEAIVRDLRGNGSVVFEHAHRRKDGTEMPVEISSRVIEYGGRQVFQSFVRDIRERKQAEEALRKLSRAVEQSPSMVVVTDAQGNIEYVNPKFTQVTGYAPGEILGKNPRVLKSGETPPEEYERLWKTLTSGGEWRGELHDKKKNGDLFWASACISPVKDGKGAITHFLAVQEDITERKCSERTLRESEERFRELATRIHVLKELMRVAVSSPHVAEVFDRVADQVKQLIDHDQLSIAVRPLGEEFYEVCASTRQGPPKGTRFPLTECAIGEVMLTGRPILWRNWSEDSPYPAEVATADELGFSAAMFVPLESRGRIIGTLNLASRQPARYAEAELRIAQEIADHLAVIVEHAILYEESKELAALQERSRLAREIHDALAQSFIGIVLELDVAERLMRTDPASARREVNRAREMAHEGLEEARRSILALRPSVLEVSPLHEAVAREIETSVPPGVTVNVSWFGTPVPVEQEVETAVFRIAREALANVRKHAQATRVDATLEYGPKALTLTIADNGSGFDTGSPQLSRRDGGFGLTSISGRAQALGGEVEVKSEPGHGTVIAACIPYAGPVTIRRQKEKVGTRRDGPPPIRVLLADDHAVARQGIRRMLEEEADIEVVAEASDGMEALARVRAFRPDVVVTDIRMPRLGGIELLSTLKEEGLPTRGIVVTAYSDGGLISNAMKAGAEGYVLKDVGKDELVRGVRAVHRGETFLQQAVASELGRQVRDAGSGGLAEALTPQEQRVLGLVAKGRRNKEIARELRLSEATVKFHLRHVFEKLGVGGRTEALGKAIELGIVNVP